MDVLNLWKFDSRRNSCKTIRHGTEDKSYSNQINSISNLVGNHPQGAYNQDNSHQRPSYKSHMFHPGHPKSNMQQHATYH